MANVIKCDAPKHGTDLVIAYAHVRIADSDNKYDVSEEDLCRDCFTPVLVTWQTGALRVDKYYTIHLIN
jgi:hypothetical protein